MTTERYEAFHAYVTAVEGEVRLKVYEGFPFVLGEAIWAALFASAALALVICGSWFGVAWLIVAEAILLRICSLPSRNNPGAAYRAEVA